MVASGANTSTDCAGSAWIAADHSSATTCWVVIITGGGVAGSGSCWPFVLFSAKHFRRGRPLIAMLLVLRLCLGCIADGEEGARQKDQEHDKQGEQGKGRGTTHCEILSLQQEMPKS